MIKLDEFNSLEFVEVRFLSSPLTKDFNLDYTIDTDFLTSFQVNFSNTTMKKTASMIIEDGQLLNILVQFRDVIVELTYIDIFEEETKLTFQVTNVHQFKGNIDSKGYELSLQDYQSYRLENSFLGKSYSSGDMGSVINDFLVELGVVEYPVNGSMPFDTPLVVPKHINNLKFFEEELYRMGQSIQGTRKGIQIFKTDEVSFEKLEVDDMFLERVPEKNYKNLILDFDIKELTRNNVCPEFETYDFNIQNNEYNTENNFDISMYQIDTKFGTESILDTVGKRPIHQRLTQHNEMVRRNALLHNGVDIVVSGYCYREVNTVQAIELVGNTTESSIRDLGNVVNSGAYLVVQIQDRFIQGSLLQKMFLRRANTFKVPDDLGGVS